MSPHHILDEGFRATIAKEQQSRNGRQAGHLKSPCDLSTLIAVPAVANTAEEGPAWNAASVHIDNVQVLPGKLGHCRHSAAAATATAGAGRHPRTLAVSPARACLLAWSLKRHCVGVLIPSPVEEEGAAAEEEIIYKRGGPTRSLVPLSAGTI